MLESVFRAAYAVPLESSVERTAAAAGPDPLSELTARQAARIVALFAGVLTARQLDAIVLRYYEERTFEAIGLELGISTAAAYRVHARALAAMRERLAQAGINRIQDLL